MPVKRASQFAPQFARSAGLRGCPGVDLRDRPPLSRKRVLRRLLPRVPSRLYVDHLPARGTDLFRAACAFDLEGVVAKWRRGTYPRDGIHTSWIKIKNRGYSQAEGRREFFEQRSDQTRRPRWSGRAPCSRCIRYTDD